MRTHEGRRTQVIGVGMRFQDVMHVQAMVCDVLQQARCTVGTDASRWCVVVQDRIDHHGIAAAADDITPRACRGVKEWLDRQVVRHGRVPHRGRSSMQ
jgi:hypothetical protein